MIGHAIGEDLYMAEVLIVYYIEHVGLVQLYSRGAERSRLSLLKFGGSRNIELIETEDETVYFDPRQRGDFVWASPVQTYLELMAGDKRDQETAEQVKSYIMSNS